ncbi:hypothetical protein [Novipirellula sp.]|uniref:hypothetical protein n=1 Tax=Novipirellula sp. TaxID=2795430 RepID=UPI00356A4D0C
MGKPQAKNDAAAEAITQETDKTTAEKPKDDAVTTETPASEPAAKETPAKPAKDTAAKEASAKENPAKETPAKEPSGKETGSKEKSAKPPAAKPAKATPVTKKEPNVRPKKSATSGKNGSLLPSEHQLEHLKAAVLAAGSSENLLEILQHVEEAGGKVAVEESIEAYRVLKTVLEE